MSDKSVEDEVMPKKKVVEVFFDPDQEKMRRVLEQEVSTKRAMEREVYDEGPCPRWWGPSDQARLCARSSPQREDRYDGGEE